MVRVLEWAGKDRHSVDGPATGTGIFTSIAGSHARFGALRGHKGEYAPFGPSRKSFRSLPYSKGPTTNRPPHLTFLGATPMFALGGGFNRSTPIMRILVAVVVAYLITGAIYVWRKLTANDYLHMPPSLIRYRAEGGTGRLIAVTLGWLIATFINKEFAYWLIFAILAAVGLYFSSI